MKNVLIWQPENPELLSEPNKIAAIYIDGKLLLFTRQSTANCFWIHNKTFNDFSRMLSDQSFFAYFYAVASETPEEMEQFIPLLKNYDTESPKRINSWKVVLDDLKQIISDADNSKIRTCHHVVVAVYREQIIHFISSEGFFSINEIKIANTADELALLLSALICDSQNKLSLLEPLLYQQIPDWQYKVKIIEESIKKLDKKLNLFKRLIFRACKYFCLYRK